MDANLTSPHEKDNYGSGRAAILSQLHSAEEVEVLRTRPSRRMRCSRLLYHTIPGTWTTCLRKDSRAVQFSCRSGLGFAFPPQPPLEPQTSIAIYIYIQKQFRGRKSASAFFGDMNGLQSTAILVGREQVALGTVCTVSDCCGARCRNSSMLRKINMKFCEKRNSLDRGKRNSTTRQMPASYWGSGCRGSK